MRRRRKPLRLLLLLGIVSGAAFYSLAASLQAEREYNALVHALAGGQESRVLESRFVRGWLTSRAQTSVEVAGGAGFVFRSAVEALGARDVRSRVGMHMVNEIEHGLPPLIEWARGGFEGKPILARIKTTLEIDQESQQALAESVGKLPPLEAVTLVRTKGQAETSFSIRGERLEARGKGYEREGRWLGLEGEIDFSEGFQHASGSVRSPGLESRGLERTLELHDVAWQFDLPAGELPVGRVTLSIGWLNLDYTTAGPTPLDVKGLKIEGESRLAAGSFGAKLAATAASLELGSEGWGPASLRVALQDVDGLALRRLRRAGLRLQSHRESGDPAQTAVVAVDVLEALPPLLARGPRLSLEQLQLETPHGNVTGEGQLALAEPREGVQPSLSSFLRGSVELELPETVLEAVTDARVRGELASEGADASDEQAFEAKARERRVAWIGDLRKQGRLSENGASVRLRTTFEGAPGAEAPAPLAAKSAPPARPPAPAAAAPAPDPAAPAADPGATPPAAPSPPAAPAPPAEAAPAP